ncbi:protein translocase subunit SecF [Prochlorococcus sp. MIT 1341]|uniref:protein translocase subunit SecF n=1 Tax=Prochlorococcus sp. MIT 1341 TaxID=3096221 RepID=UPI002A74EDA1|nr:protein translocase subunit SecF [Prochlorococcus sp. MIT 1341]
MKSSPSNTRIRLRLCRNRRLIWLISGTCIFLSALGLILCILNPSIKAPLRPGLDFTGGTQIQLERNCDNECGLINSKLLEDSIKSTILFSEEDNVTTDLSSARVQILDSGKSVVLRLPFISATQSNQIIEKIKPLIGQIQGGSESIETIGPSLGGQLLRSSLISLLVAFSGIALYITFRYDRLYAFLALIALGHDVLIVCGIFAWLGIAINLEVESLFAVALLTIAGYSVNDTVVVFDRIRERSRYDSSLSLAEQIDRAVSATLTRTLYTSGTTLLPLIALILFGGSTLYWFAVALSLGVLVGSWSSIALAPSLLSLRETAAKGPETLDDSLSVNE